MSETDRKISRRSWVKYAGGAVAVAVVAGAGYGLYEITKPPSTSSLSVIDYEVGSTDATKALVPGFENETGIKTTFDIMPFDPMLERELSAATSHSGAYDVMHVDLDFEAAFSKAGYLEPLDKYVDASKADLGIDDFGAGLFDYHSLHRGPDDTTRRYSMIDKGHVSLMLYRKDLMDKYVGNVPNDWTEFEDACKKLTGNGVWGTTARMSRSEGIEWDWVPYLYSFGGSMYDQNWKPTMNSPQAVESLNYWFGLYQKGYMPPGTTAYGWDEVMTAFTTGKVATIVSENWAIPGILSAASEEVKSNIGYAEIPGYKLPDGTIRRAPFLGGGAWGISVDSKNKDAAWKFIVYMSGMKHAREYVDAGGTANRYSIVNDPELQKTYPWFPLVPHVWETGIKPYAHDLPEYMKVMDPTVADMHEALLGNMSIQDAMNKAADECYNILKDAGYYTATSTTTT